MYQQSLFDIVSFNIVKPLKRAMVAAEKSSGLSRDQIVDGMNDLAEQYGVRLSKGNGQKLPIATLEKWLNPNDLARVINVKALVIYCSIVGNKEPLGVLIKPLGGQLIDNKEAKLLAWAKEYHLVKQSRSRMKKIEEEL